MNILYVNCLSGIKIGEIGTKLGMKNINNGFLALENVRIPREQMLMKNSKVLEVRNTYLSAILRHVYF
jgi:acyl-CoA oxidase